MSEWCVVFYFRPYYIATSTSAGGCEGTFCMVDSIIVGNADVVVAKDHEMAQELPALFGIGDVDAIPRQAGVSD